MKNLTAILILIFTMCGWAALGYWWKELDWLIITIIFITNAPITFAVVDYIKMKINEKHIVFHEEG